MGRPPSRAQPHHAPSPRDKIDPTEFDVAHHISRSVHSFMQGKAVRVLRGDRDGTGSREDGKLNLSI